MQDADDAFFASVEHSSLGVQSALDARYYLRYRRYALMHGDEQALAEFLPTLPGLTRRLTPPLDSRILQLPIQVRMTCPAATCECAASCVESQVQSAMARVFHKSLGNLCAVSGCMSSAGCLQHR